MNLNYINLNDQVGGVDLGLPSKTLWSPRRYYYNPFDLYTYYGSYNGIHLIPTFDHVRELYTHCFCDSTVLKDLGVVLRFYNLSCPDKKLTLPTFRYIGAMHEPAIFIVVVDKHGMLNPCRFTVHEAKIDRYTDAFPLVLPIAYSNDILN